MGIKGAKRKAKDRPKKGREGAHHLETRNGFFPSAGAVQCRKEDHHKEPRRENDKGLEGILESRVCVMVMVLVN